MIDDYFDQGVAAISSGDVLAAVGWFEKAVQTRPKDAETVACLGQSLFWLGKRNEGLGYLRRAGNLLVKSAKKSKNINEIIALTEQLQSCNDFNGSIKLIQQAIQINKADARAFQLLSIAYSRINNHDQAIMAVKRALSLLPNNAALEILLASLNVRAGKLTQAKSGLENVIQNTGLSPVDACNAHKELASVLDKLGEFDQVFAHLNEAANLSADLAEVKKQDSLLVPNMLNSYQAEFDSELLTRWSADDFVQQRPAPVFVVGFFRSGTTLVQEVLAAHPDVIVGDEAEFILAMRTELARMFPAMPSVPQQLKSIDVEGIKYLRQFYWNKVDERYGKSNNKAVFVDKTTMNTIDLGLINCVFPEAKVIFVLRDPRDVCVSCFMQQMTLTAVTVHLTSWQSTIGFYIQVMQWWMYIKQNMTIDYLELRYEDGVMEFEQTFKNVFNYLALDWSPEVINFHQNAVKKIISSPSFHQVSRPLYRSSINRWHNYPHQFSLIEKDLESLIEALGYSLK